LVLDGSKFPVPSGFRYVSSEQIRAGEGDPARVAHPDPGLSLVFAADTAIPSAWYQFELEFPAEGLVDVVAQFTFADDQVLWLRLPLIARNHFLAHLRVEGAIEQLALIASGSGRLTEPTLCRFERVGWLGQLAAAGRRGRDIFHRDGLGVLSSGLNYFWRRVRGSSIAISRGSAAAAGETPYETWMRIFDEHPERDRARHEARLAALTRRPLMSILVELSSADPAVLDRLARGVSEQIYPSWELLLAVPPHLGQEVKAGLASRGLDAGRVRLTQAGASRAESLNAALAVSQGDYVLPLTEGALLRPHALLDLASTIECVPSAQLVNSDEDRIDAAGQRSGWRFKPAWSPNLFEASDYVGELTLLRRDTVQRLAGWRSAGRTPQHDLISRLADSAEPRAIVHLAKLLVHGPAERQTPRCAAEARSRATPSAPRISLIIPTRDNADVLATCIRSIRSRTRYDNYEILVVDNGSMEGKTKRLFAELSSDPAIRILPRAEPFNFSRLNNVAARAAAGTILGLINNDIEVQREDWLDEMVALAMRPDVGCVGAKLLYPDGRIQHGGVVLGLYGVAGHAHRFAAADEPGYLDRLRAVHEVSAVTAACLLVRKQVFDQVGGLDENLAVAFNDVAFCLKVRAAGYLNLWTPFAELIHHESASRGRDLTPAKAQRFAGEYAIMQRRWGRALLNDPYYSPHLTYDGEDFSLRQR
jgi:O-antigen biosynthesis protein